MSENGIATDNLAAFLRPSSPNFNDSDIIPRANGNLYESPSSGYDMTTLRSENRILKSKLRQLQSDLSIEQDTVISLRKKLNTTERDRLDAVSRSNEQVQHLDSDVAKLRSQLEKGEAVRQNLEFALTKAKRELNHERRSVSERDSLLNEVNVTMKQKIQDMTSQIENLCDELDNTKLKANEENRKLKREIEEKDTELEKMRADVDSVENEKTKLEYNLLQHQQNCRDLEVRIQELEGEKRQQCDDLRRQITEYDMLKEQHEIRKCDLQDGSARIKTLEEAIEAERAAHLESKFNSEIIQLRMQDLESALDLEKNTKLEALASTEKLNQQIKDLQHIYDEERKLSMETKEKLEKRWMPILRAEKEYALLSKQLNRELEEKRGVIKDLSRQLEAHQKDFNDLKHELNKAKKKQVNLEDSYTNCVRELEILNENFKADDVLNPPTKKTKKSKTQAEKPTPSKPPQPQVLLETLRHTLITFKRKFDEASSDLERVKEQKEELDKEAAKFKELVWSKDKALHTSQSGVEETRRELRRVQEDNKNLEKVIKQLRGDLDTVHKQLQKEKTKSHELAEQCSHVVTKSKASERGMSDFMVHLYQQLAVDVPVAEKSDIRQKSFDDLSLMISDKVTKMVNNLRWMGEKIKHLEASLENKEELVEQMQAAHEEQLEKLAGVAEGRSQQWLQQKAEMEKHYKALLGEIHDRHAKTQTLADQAWEKVRMTGSLQQGLERECEDLRKQLMRIQDEHHCLLATCALLCGAIYPLYQRNNALATQRDILTEQFFNFQNFKREVQKLVDALSLDKLNNKDIDLLPLGGRKLTPLIRFRTAAVAIIAANRLKNLRNECKMFVTKEGVLGAMSSLVCTGGIEGLKTGTYKGVAEISSPAAREGSLGAGEAHCIEWLCSGNLLSTVLATMGDLVFTLHNARRGEQGYDQRKVIQTARNSFQKFICHLPSNFPAMGAGATSALSSLRERTSLVRFLGYGLNHALARGALETGSNQTYLESSGNMVAALQQRMLEFTKRLHMAEVERRDLRVEVSKLSKAKQSLAASNVDAERMTQELETLRDQVSDTVERARFDELCAELSRMLQREQEAHQLLKEQSGQIYQLNKQLQRHSSKTSQKEQSLTEAVQGMADAQMELKRQEQRVRQLTRQIQQQDADRRPLDEKVKDAESALRTAAKDREAVVNYIKNIEASLKQMQSQMPMAGQGEGHDVSRLLSPELLPPNLHKLGPELRACQSLVGAFVEGVRLVGKRLESLETELQQEKKHSTLLRQELAAACRREYDDELESLQRGDGSDVSAPAPFTPSRTMLGSSQSTEPQPKFSALQQESSVTSPPSKTKKQQSKLPPPKTYVSSITKIPAVNTKKRGKTMGGERN